MTKHPLSWSLVCAMCTSCSQLSSTPPPIATSVNKIDQRAFTVAPDRKRPRVGSTKKKRRSHVVDSGASVHCINDKSQFETIYEDHHPVHITVANKQVLTAEAVGTVKLFMRNHLGRVREITLHNVVYHPDFSDNLLSVHRLWKDNRISTKFSGYNQFTDETTGERFSFDHSPHGGYRTEAMSAKKVIDSQLIHSRFGHCSERRLNKLRDRCVNYPGDSDKWVSHDPSTCDACQQGGMKSKPSGKRPKDRYTYFGEKLSSDLCGPFPKSAQGYRYVICVVDASTNLLFTKCLKSKSSEEVQAALEDFLLAHAYLLPSKRPVTWHTDNGGEFMSGNLHEFCHEFSIKRGFSIPYKSPTNAHAERMWGILLRTTRILMAQSGVHESMWPYALAHATHLHNILPSTKLAGEMSPHEATFGELPNVSRIRVWGCLVWYHLNKKDRLSKLTPRAVPAVHLGFDLARKAYIVYVPFLNRITTSEDVNFQEHRFMVFDDHGVANMPRNIKPIKDAQYQYREDRDDVKFRKKILDKSERPAQADEQSHEGDNGSKSSSSDSDAPKPELPTRAEQDVKGKNPPRSNRNPNPAYQSIMIDDVNMPILHIDAHAMLSDIVVPTTFEQATKSRYAPRWWEAMKAEIEGLLAHGTWKNVELSSVPKGRKVTKSRWCYTIKYNRDGSIERFKARFVVCGYSQVQGEDYTHAFSATLRATSFRMLMAIAAGENLKMEHFDVKNAFTQSDIDAEIYTQPPKGFETIGKDGKPMILKLIKSLYGTKQASRLWQLKLRDHLVNKMGFQNSTTDPCMFIKRKGKEVIILGVYVDDIIVAHKNVDLNEFIKGFCGPGGFNSKHLGSLSWFLGMAIDRHDDGSVTINQTQYVKKLVSKFFAKPPEKRATPCKEGVFQRLRPAQSDIEREKASRVPYLQLIGSLLYLSCMTRPDIAYHMAILCSFMHDPTVQAYSAALDLLAYVATTSTSHLTFTGSCACPLGIPDDRRLQVESNHGMVLYSDASWHSSDDLGRNMFGFVMYMYGGPVSFAAKKLKVVALSSAEAEYAAVSYSCKELVFVRNMCDFLGVKLTGHSVVAVDNQAAIKIAENMGVTARNKHFQDSIHYFRHLVDHLVAAPCYVTTKQQCADGFTKPLTGDTFKQWRSRVLSVPS